MISNNRKTLVVLLGSVFALGFAYYEQYLGLHPCELCMWQRYAYAAAILISIIALNTKPKIFKILVSAALLVEFAIAVYHSGIEQHWWEGFSTCSSGMKTDSLDALRQQLSATPLVRCDEPQWFFLKLSMANWNAVYAFGLFVVSLGSCRQKSI